MLRDRFSEAIRILLAEDQWLVAETPYQPKDTLANEAIFGLTNGRMGNRASHEEGDVRRTLPANYIHGVFDRSEAFMRELCNTPDWTKLKVYHECKPIGVESGKLLDYVRVLDMRNGLVAKHYVMENDEGECTQVETIKILSRSHPRVGMIRMMVTPLNYGGILEFENIIDATVTNFIDFPRFRVKHLKTEEVSDLDGMGCFVQSATRDFGLSIGTATVLRMCDEDGKDALRSRSFRPYGEVACEFADALLTQGQTLTVDKFAAIATERDCKGVRAQVKRELEDVLLRGFSRELDMHRRCMKQLWKRADLVIDGDEKLSHAVRFNIFHLMNTPDPLDNSVNIGAKLMHGEEYGGHAFWDTELFVLPFFDYVFPEVARKLVEYRYLMLEQATKNARANGYDGAQYPWESADTGEEECPAWTIEYDGSCYRCHVAEYEHHVTADISYGLKHYVDITGDTEFMETMGTEVLLQTARFWASRMEWSEAHGHYVILQVTGPDEWHEPVDNNAYTNHLARWNLLSAMTALQELEQNKPRMAEELRKKLNLKDAELEDWKKKAAGIYLHAKEGLIEQFDGYFSIPDAVVTRWDEKGMPLMPESCKGKRGMQRCILKQADVVMLMFLFPEAFDQETQRINFDYYEQRTLHRSSLSPSIHCIVGLRVNDARRAYAYLERSAYVDITNNQKNTREGIHAASAGGTWQCVTLGYCGMSVSSEGKLCFDPRLPERWNRVTYSIMWRSQLLSIEVTQDDVTIRSEREAIPYEVKGIQKWSEVRHESA